MLYRLVKGENTMRDFIYLAIILILFVFIFAGIEDSAKQTELLKECRTGSLERGKGEIQ